MVELRVSARYAGSAEATPHADPSPVRRRKYDRETASLIPSVTLPSLLHDDIKAASRSNLRSCTGAGPAQQTPPADSE